MLSRMPGYYIEEYDAQGFASFELDTDPPTGGAQHRGDRPRAEPARGTREAVGAPRVSPWRPGFAL